MNGRRDQPRLNAAAPLTARSVSLQDGLADSRVLRALDLMRGDELMEPAAIAVFLNLSLSRFRHLFKKETGVSLKQYQKLVRLARARELLENSFLRIKEITAVLGIKDVSHFTRDYKKMYEQTPLQTRTLSSQPTRQAHVASSAKKQPFPPR